MWELKYLGMAFSFLQSVKVHHNLLLGLHDVKQQMSLRLRH